MKDQAGQRIIQYDYDDKGRRIQSFSQSGTINYFYDGDEVIYETDGSNHVLREYIWDDSGSPVAMIKNGHTYYYHLNGHGDVVALTDEDGQEVAKYEYDAWGNVLSQSGTLAKENPYRYASYKYDTETGFYYLLSRYYNPQHGNFITLDLEQDMDLEIPLNRNGYSYSLNNPVSLVDDDGNFPFIPIIIIVIVRVVAKEVVKTAVKKVAQKAATKAIKKATTKTYQTYTKTHPKTGKVYTGRTSGRKTPLENVTARDRFHHMNKQGYGRAFIDKSSSNKNAIRGREQQMIIKNAEPNLKRALLVMRIMELLQKIRSTVSILKPQRRSLENREKYET
ncbi:hypothetical protein C0Q44_18300 [Paenibacillus sp. PCH8]|nr:hypothetical protein C0Q44_18300 [Paenibacillus sp. PCH8]